MNYFYLFAIRALPVSWSTMIDGYDVHVWTVFAFEFRHLTFDTHKDVVFHAIQAFWKYTCSDVDWAQSNPLGHQTLVLEYKIILWSSNTSASFMLIQQNTWNNCLLAHNFMTQYTACFHTSLIIWRSFAPRDSLLSLVLIPSSNTRTRCWNSTSPIDFN